MAKWIFVHSILDAIGSFIKYFLISVAELWDSINIFVRVLEVFITRMTKSLVPYKLLSIIPKV